jgi:HlyD family secretion protein
MLAELEDRLERPLREQRAAEAAGALAKLELLRAGARREELLGAAGELAAIQADEALALSEVERLRRLLDHDTIAIATFEAAEARYKVTSGQRAAVEQHAASLRKGARPQELAMAEAAVNATQAALAAVDARLAAHRLCAPVTGLVVDVDAHPGETMPAAASVVVLADVEHPRVDVFVPQDRLGALRVGDEAKVRVDGTSRTYSGTLESLGRRIEFTPRFLFSERERPNLVMRVRVRITDADAHLHAGVPARVAFL